MPRDMLNIVTHESAEPVFTEPDQGDFQIGQQVRHPAFGVGRIVEISPKRAAVDFPRFGRKTLLLEFARLQAV